MQTTQSNTPTPPLVTFIVAYYNLPVTMLCQCLDSILALSLSNAEREIIVIDDGSDDNPLPSLGRYLADIIYVRQRNSGLSEARNRGIQLANGQYVQFVDADDYLLRTPYEHCLSPSADFNTDDLNSGTEYLSHHNLHASACGYLFRRAIIGQLRFTPGILHEDEEFTPQLLLRAETVVSTNAQAYYYRRRPHSITTEADPRRVVRRLNDSLQVILKLNRIADTLPTSERLALSRRVAQLTMDYIYNIIVQTRSRHYLDRKLAFLRKGGLFPLPDRDYTTKYKWFRRLTNSSMGLSLLMSILPMIDKER